MKSQKFFSQTLTMLVVLSFALLANTNLYADASGIVKSLLIDISGWEAAEPDGGSVDMPGMKMITASRTYQAGDKTFTASIIIGNSAMIQAQQQSTQMESADAQTATGMIDGFYVVRAFNKSDQSGYLVININSKSMDGIMFLFTYSAIKPETALKITKQFNWSKIKSQTASMIQ